MLKKIVPMLFCGVAAVSFSAFAQTSVQGDMKQPHQGRSADGGQPDSSRAQGSSPATPASPDSGASTGSGARGTHSSDAATDRKARGQTADEEARRKTREGGTSGIGGGTTTTGSGATTTTPGSTGGASTGN